MFNGATNFNGSLNGWDTRSLTGDGMLGMFQNASNFNQPVNHFKTENITSLFHTFYGMSSFNQDLDKRNVSNVTNMQEMFFRSSGFNGSLSGWNTASLTGNGIASMFENATSFNQPVNHFKTNNITSLNYIFR
jgi:surface protein